MCAQITPFTVVSAAAPAIRFAEHNESSLLLLSSGWPSFL
jgi:hypothetical protein